MTASTTRELVDQARATSRGVAAFNVITIEHAEAIVLAAESTRTPVILQVSENAVRFHLGRLEPLAAACAAIQRAASVSVALHLDHATDHELYREAFAFGFSSFMFDAARLPYDGNVAATASAADWGHQRGLWVEAELGEVGGKDGAHKPGARTDPDQAAEYVAATGVDGLAVAVGSSHAMTTRTAILDQELVRRLRDSVPVPLVLHGSSGVPDQELERGVASGLVKVNIGTALNVAFTQAVRQRVASAQSVDPRKYLAVARDEMAATVARLLATVSGTEGASGEQAPGIPPALSAG
jgi:fructose-bisphosphate aldolase, class II